MDINKIIKEMGGINLDIACGRSKQPGHVGMDIQDLPGVDIVHNIIDIPWPLPDEIVLSAVASHIVEHIPPVAVRSDGTMWFPFLAFMDELWRVMKPGGEVAIATPHGYSPGFHQDPTHCNSFNENTFYYFDPDHDAYDFYTPRPWKIKEPTRFFRTWNVMANINVVLVKVMGASEDGKDIHNGSGEGGDVVLDATPDQAGS